MSSKVIKATKTSSPMQAKTEMQQRGDENNKSGFQFQKTLVRTAQKLYAKAIYDNTADTPDELSFKKGDILNVLEQDTEGLKGWWLCTLRGAKGLCPGNRLRILNSYDSGCFSPSPLSSPSTSLAASTATLNSSICSAEIYENTPITSGANGNGDGNNISNGCMRSSQTQLSHHIQQQQQQQQQPNSLQPHLRLQQQQRQGTRRSWHVFPNKVITPQRQGDVYVYNCSNPNSQQPSHQPQQQYQRHTAQQLHQIYSNQNIYQNVPMMSTSNGSNDFDTYDIPKPATPVNYDCPKSVMCRITAGTSSPVSHLRFDAISLKDSCCTPSIEEEESYDVPRPLPNASLLHHHTTLTPSSSNSSLMTSESLSLSFSSSNRSSLVNMPDYDIPRRNPMAVRAVQKQQQIMNTNCTTYDFPVHSVSSTPIQERPLPQPVLNETKELPLELNSALETLAKLQTEVTAAIMRLLSFVSPNWRLREKLEPVLMEVKLAAVRLRTALHDLTEFGEGALGNATRSDDRSLAQKLRPLVRALRDADKLVYGTSNALDNQSGWTLDNLAYAEDKHNCRAPDKLDQLIACAQSLTEDVRQIASFIQGNALLLFRRNIYNEESETDGSDGTAKDEWVEDYDYVSFESKDEAARKNSLLREAIPANLKQNFDTAIEAAEATVKALAANNTTPTPTSPQKKEELTDKDKQLLRYYAVQIVTHLGNLQQAIDSFLETVEKNQPPKFFIAYGKFVVVSAHNLVTIGDIVHRNISKMDLRERISQCTDALSDALKTCVMKSKKASACFPSVKAVQEMVDSVVFISQLAFKLKAAMLEATTT